MPNSFDPYEKWFGISPLDQPPSHYQLLGLKEFESDQKKIQKAGENRVEFLQDVSSGEHVNEAQQLLNQVAKAVVCLTDQSKKKAYDKKLHAAKLPVAKVSSASPPAPTPKPFAPAPVDLSADTNFSITGRPSSSTPVRKSASPTKPISKKATKKAVKRKPQAGIPIWLRASVMVGLLAIIGSMIFFLVNREKKSKVAKSRSFHVPEKAGESSLPSMNIKTANDKEKKTDGGRDKSASSADDDEGSFNIPVPTANTPSTTKNGAESDANLSANAIVADFENWESDPDEPTKTFDSPLGRWELSPHAELNAKIDKPRKHIHLKGSTNTTVTVTFPEGMNSAGTLKIRVERKSPTGRRVEFHVKKSFDETKWFGVKRSQSPRIKRRKPGQGPKFVTYSYELLDADIRSIQLSCKSDFDANKRNQFGILIASVTFVPAPNLDE